MSRDALSSRRAASPTTQISPPSIATRASSSISSSASTRSVLPPLPQAMPRTALDKVVTSITDDKAALHETLVDMPAQRSPGPQATSP